MTTNQPTPTMTSTQLAPTTTSTQPTPATTSQPNATAIPAETMVTSTQPTHPTMTKTTSSPLSDVTNTIATSNTKEHERWGKSSAPAVIGTGFTEKNFAMKEWLDDNPGGLKCDFEAFYKTLSAAAKKVYNEHTKSAQKVANAEKKRK